jgi:hypothetical protein
MQVELAIDVGEMPLDGTYSDNQFLRDFRLKTLDKTSAFD